MLLNIQRQKIYLFSYQALSKMPNIVSGSVLPLTLILSISKTSVLSSETLAAVFLQIIVETP